MEAVVAKKFPEMSTLLRFCSEMNAMSSSLALFASLLRGFEASFSRELRSVGVHRGQVSMECGTSQEKK